MTTPTAFIIGLNRTDGRVSAVRVRCPWCGRIHVHRWPLRDATKPRAAHPPNTASPSTPPERTTP